MNVTVYSTPTCPWCTRVKEYLNYKEVKFKEINVAQDRDGAMEMIQKSGQRGVPVVDINGNIVVGFNQAEIDRLLSRS
ncbi:MAG: glutaredoxin 3 [Petroclostridium sp.]|jgi:glutaredoxin-like YruB-family protein|nr:glutaredoxin-like protein YruB-family [Clostridia bacterium]MDK2811561.1 glutaredoxin 3 [Petroclostridium sp.]